MRLSVQGDERVQQFAEFTAERLQLAATSSISREMLEDSFLRVREDLAGGITAHFVASLWSREVRTEKEAGRGVPRSWWDHLKWRLSERFPRTLGRLVRTVRFEQIDTVLRVYHMCPHLPAAPGERHLCWLSMSGEERENGGEVSRTL